MITHRISLPVLAGMALTTRVASGQTAAGTVRDAGAGGRMRIF